VKPCLQRRATQPRDSRAAGTRRMFQQTAMSYHPRLDLLPEERWGVGINQAGKPNCTSAGRLMIVASRRRIALRLVNASQFPVSLDQNPHGAEPALGHPSIRWRRGWKSLLRAQGAFGLGSAVCACGCYQSEANSRLRKGRLAANISDSTPSY